MSASLCPGPRSLFLTFLGTWSAAQGTIVQFTFLLNGFSNLAVGIQTFLILVPKVSPPSWVKYAVVIGMPTLAGVSIALHSLGGRF